MTLDQSLLTGLVVATVAGAIIAWLVHRTQAKWRQTDLLRELISKWASQVNVPNEVSAIQYDEHDLRLPIEKEAHFISAFKLSPKKVRRQWGEFIEARSTYIRACHRLYKQIGQECVERTGLPIGQRRDTKNWPARVLLTEFILPIYEQVFGTMQGTFRLEDISYDVRRFSHSGEGFARKGWELIVTYGNYSGLGLAQADDEAVLQRIKSTHREIMQTDYRRKFAAEVEHVRDLLSKAKALADRVRDDLCKLEVS